MKSQSITIMAIAVAALAIAGAASLRFQTAPLPPSSPITVPATTTGTYTDADGATWYERCESGFCRSSPDAESLVRPVITQAAGAGGLPTIDASALEAFKAATREAGQ